MVEMTKARLGHYQVTKHYDSLVSVAFRQWRASSHCRFIHGYALSFSLTFVADTLTKEGWVVGFGDLALIKQALKETFDHKVLVASDDPKLPQFELMQADGLMQLTLLDHVCCEAFAVVVHSLVNDLIPEKDQARGLHCCRVSVSEHAKNAAIFQSDMDNL